MREIKFRAWVPSDKAMVQHREVIERAHLQFNDSLNHTDIIMQFTGLKDKNGKEIYEGDIYEVAKNRIYEVRFILETQYEEKTCGFGLWNEAIGFAFIIDGFAIEHGRVIGNIYENPELLK